MNSLLPDLRVQVSKSKQQVGNPFCISDTMTSSETISRVLNSQLRVNLESLQPTIG